MAEIEVVEGMDESREKSHKNKKKEKKKTSNDRLKSKKVRNKKDKLSGTDDESMDACQKKSKPAQQVVKNNTPAKIEMSSKFKTKREEKEKLLSQIPTCDNDGILYTKVQIRRMLKRVKRGLPPLENLSEGQLQERKNRDKREREKELDEDFYGIFSSKQGDMTDEDDDEQANDSEEKNNMDKNEKDADNSTEQSSNDTETKEAVKSETNEPDKINDPYLKQNLSQHLQQNPKKKKARREKPVPADYVCQACKNEPPNTTPHWIYDCPKKISVPGCNRKKKKKQVELQSPKATKVFISGLPLGIQQQDIRNYLNQKLREISSTKDSNGNDDDDVVKFCKLATFPDSNRCNGQAFVTFKTEECSAKALKEFDGSKVDLSLLSNFSKSSEDNGGRKNLHLRVSRMKNRKHMKKSQQ